MDSSSSSNSPPSSPPGPSVNFDYKHLQNVTGFIISTIFYVRNCFEENVYSIIDLEDIKPRILSNESGNENVSKIINYSRSAYKALKKGYLKTLVLEIFEKNDFNIPIEIYEINYDYNKFKNYKSFEEKRDHINEILINLIKKLEKIKLILLENKTYVSFKLFYNAVTPDDYEPEGFIPGDKNLVSNTKNMACEFFSKDGINIQIQTLPENIASSSNSSQRIQNVFDSFDEESN